MKRITPGPWGREPDSLSETVALAGSQDRHLGGPAVVAITVTVA